MHIPILSKIDLKKCPAFEEVVISLESVKDFRAKALFRIKNGHTLAVYTDKERTRPLSLMDDRDWLKLMKNWSRWKAQQLTDYHCASQTPYYASAYLFTTWDLKFRGVRLIRKSSHVLNWDIEISARRYFIKVTQNKVSASTSGKDFPAERLYILTSFGWETCIISWVVVEKQ